MSQFGAIRNIFQSSIRKANIDQIEIVLETLIEMAYGILDYDAKSIEEFVSYAMIDLEDEKKSLIEKKLNNFLSWH